MPVSKVVREATRADRPTLNTKETQCCICHKMFSSDSACELTKPYRRPVSEKCKDPRSLGMESKDRDGILVWSVPMDPVVKARLELMWEARRKKSSTAQSVTTQKT